MTNESVGWDVYQRIRRADDTLRQIGMCLSSSRFGHLRNRFAVIPYRDEELGVDGLPHYSTDSELFHGDLDQVEIWLMGVMWARDYDRMLGISSTRRRERREQDERNRRLTRILGKKEENESDPR